MTREILIKDGTQVVWADVGGDFGDSPVAGTLQITLVSLGSGAARQGVKADLGATRARDYDVTLRVEFDVAPTSGDEVSLWWASSVSGTAGTANPGGVSGTDAAYTGTGGDSLADSILQLRLIGVLICTADAAVVVQQQTFRFDPRARYGSIVVFNEADQAFEGDDVEMSVVFTPVVDEVQDAA